MLVLLATVFSMKWYATLSRHLNFLGIHARLKARVYTKKILLTRGIFHGLPLQNFKMQLKIRQIRLCNYFSSSARALIQSKLAEKTIFVDKFLVSGLPKLADLCIVCHHKNDDLGVSRARTC